MTKKPPISDAQILRAAADEFAEKGFDGARVDEIARRAGVNKATLYYRIGDKDALYEAVLVDMHGKLADRLGAQTAQVDDPREQLRRFILVFAQETRQRPFSPAIMLREVASGGRHLPDGALRHMMRNFACLAGILNKGRQTGAFRNTNPIAVHRLIIGSICLYTTDAPIRERGTEMLAAPAPHADFGSHEELADEAYTLILAAVSNPSPKQPEE